MSDMPKEIWAWNFTKSKQSDVMKGGWDDAHDRKCVSYTRTDTLSTWQPIESAPKDGTPILTFSDECEVLEAFLVCWWSEAKAEKSGFGWCAYEVDHALCPDLWMPLPTPPKGDTHD